MAYIGKKPSFEQVRTDEFIVRQGAAIDLTAGSITANLNVNEKSFISISVSGTSSNKTIISGILAPTATDPAKNGKIITLKNTSNVDIFLLEEDIAADAANRIITGFSKQIIVSAGSMVTLSYDINLERWGVQSSSTETLSSLVVGTNNIQLNSEEIDLSSMSRKTALVELTVGAVSTLKSISAGKNGELLMLVNKTGNVLQISDEDVLFTAENRILTGTGAPVIIQNNASIFLAYITDNQSVSRWNIVGGTGSGGGAVEQVEQTGIGNLTTYPLGTPLYVDNAGPDYWKKASAISANLAEVAGLVSRRLGDDRSEIALSGEVSGVKSSVFVEGVLPDRGSVVFLSETAGKLTVSDMTTVGYISKPIGIVHAVNLLDASVDIMFYNQRGVVVGGVNARTQINLNGSSTTSTVTPIQNISAYEAGELAGWIYINGTTDYRFYFQSQFAKNGLGTDYNIAVPQTVGDTPPVGFAIDVIDAEVRISLPAVPGFVNSYVNFALNAPAVGASLPLSINSSGVYTTYKSVGGAYAITSTDSLVVATGASPYTVTLPSVSGNTGKTYTIKCDLDEGIVLTVNVAGGGLIDLSSVRTLLKNESLLVVGDGTKWINLSSGSLEGRGSVPLGAIIPIGDAAGWVLPVAGEIKDGYALCNGQSYPTGSNASFSGNMPNLSDERFLQGSTSGGTVGGANTVTLAIANLPAHSHTMSHTHGMTHTHTINHNHPFGTTSVNGNHFHTLSPGYSNQGESYAYEDSGSPAGSTYRTSTTGDHQHTMSIPTHNGSSGSSSISSTGASSEASTGNTGSGTAFDIRPKYFNVVYLMRVI